jgi:uncharacterized protein (TIGR00369 family)
MIPNQDRESPGSSIWLEPVRGGLPDRSVLGLSGLEQMRAYIDQKVSPPPIHHLTGMRPTAAGPDSATFVMPATPWLLSPPGYVSLGALAMLADAGVGSAIQVGLPPATPYTTSDLSLAFIRPALADEGMLAAPGRLIHGGRSLGVADAMIEDGGGRPVAHCTTRCFVLPPIDPPPDPPDRLEPITPATYDTPDPYQRPAAGEPLGQDVWDRMTGLEVMRALAAGDLPRPPITHLTGLWPVDFDEGRATFALPCTAWLCNPTGYVQGGVIALLADTVLATAVQTTVGRRTVYSPLDLKVNFLRPVLPDGRELVGSATVVHRGRSMAVARADIQNAEGKAVAVATGTALIREGHPWRPQEPQALEVEMPEPD